MSAKQKGHNKIQRIDQATHDWTTVCLDMDYNVNSGKYALYPTAWGDGTVGIYVGISYCPFCGEKLNEGGD